MEVGSFAYKFFEKQDFLLIHPFFSAQNTINHIVLILME